MRSLEKLGLSVMVIFFMALICWNIFYRPKDMGHGISDNMIDSIKCRCGK